MITAHEVLSTALRLIAKDLGLVVSRVDVEWIPIQALGQPPRVVLDRVRIEADLIPVHGDTPK